MEIFLNIINGLLILYFGATNYISIAIVLLYMLGCFLIFRKSGSKWWITLVPFYREYELARCANREADGRTYALILFINNVFSVMGYYFQYFTSEEYAVQLNVVLAAIQAAIIIPWFIYNLRVFNGLVEIYNSTKWWAVAYALMTPRFIPLLYWGFSKKCQPSYKVDELEEEMKKLARHGSVSVMEEGLTVNLNERSVKGFLKEKKVLLRDIHMAIPAGHMVLLLGGSGAGKTTFLNAVNGYEKADAEVLLEGKNMYTEYKQMIYEVGFVPQSQMMRDKDTVIKTMRDYANLRLPKGISKEDKERRIEEVMDIFGLIPVKDSMVGQLSGGQKKRLSISIEYLSNPSLFILDEPDSGLDGVMARELFERLRAVADSGRIVIVITHSPDRVVDLFDDVIVLAKDSARTGRLAYYGSIKEARSFFERESMEEIVKRINQVEEGGDGLADEYILKYAEVVQNG